MSHAYPARGVVSYIRDTSATKAGEDGESGDGGDDDKGGSKLSGTARQHICT